MVQQVRDLQLTRTRSERARTISALATAWVCAACGGSTEQIAASSSATPTDSTVQCVGLRRADGHTDTSCQTLSPDQGAAGAALTASSYPVCGVGLGPPYGALGASGPVQFLLGDDSAHHAPKPPLIQYSYVGRFVLKVSPDCDHGDNIKIEPESAADITTRAPSADGLLAGIGIQAHARHFRITGSGAVKFDQEVSLKCPTTPHPCPTDPSKDGPIVPTVTPLPTPWDPKLRP